MKKMLSLLIFYAKNVKNTNSPENFCYYSVYFHMSGSSPQTLWSKGSSSII